MNREAAVLSSNGLEALFTSCKLSLAVPFKASDGVVRALFPVGVNAVAKFAEEIVGFWCGGEITTGSAGRASAEVEA